MVLILLAFFSIFSVSAEEEGTRIGTLLFDAHSGQACRLVYDAGQFKESQVRAAAELTLGQSPSALIAWPSPSEFPLADSSKRFLEYQESKTKVLARVRSLDLHKDFEPLRKRILEDLAFEVWRVESLNRYFQTNQPAALEAKFENLLPAVQCRSVIAALRAPRTEAGFRDFWKSEVRFCMLKGKKSLTTCEASVREQGMTQEKFLSPRFTAESLWPECVARERGKRPVLLEMQTQPELREKYWGFALLNERCGEKKSDVPETDGWSHSFH